MGETTPFDTSLLEEKLAQQAEAWEMERQQLVDRIFRLLDETAPQYGIKLAYLFGSVTRPRRFHPRADVDIAVEEIAPEQFFDAMGAISMALGREVDLVDLRKCHFADRIRKEGIRWTAKRSSC